MESDDSVPCAIQSSHSSVHEYNSSGIYSTMPIIKFIPTLRSIFLSPPPKSDFNPEDETLVTIYQSKQHYTAEDLNVHYLV